MQIPRSILLALFGALAAYAQTEATGPNAFTNTAFSATAGEPLTLTWNPTTSGTVSLILRSGASSDLNVVEPIAQNIQNSGSYSWTPSEDAVRGSDYTIEIVSDDDPSATNYSAYFVLNSDNTVASTTAGSSTSVAPLPTTITTASASSGSASSTDSSSSSTETSESTTTGSASSSSTATSTRSPSASDLQATSSSSEAAGARATAMVGLLGAVALGAIAL